MLGSAVDRQEHSRLVRALRTSWEYDGGGGGGDSIRIGDSSKRGRGVGEDTGWLNGY